MHNKGTKFVGGGRYSAPLVEIIDITPESCIAASDPAAGWNDGSIPNIPGNFNDWGLNL